MNNQLKTKTPLNGNQSYRKHLIPSTKGGREIERMPQIRARALKIRLRNQSCPLILISNRDQICLSTHFSYKCHGKNKPTNNQVTTVTV